MSIFLYEHLKTLMEGAFFRDVGGMFHSNTPLNSDGIISKARVDKAYMNVCGTMSVNFIVHGEI